MGFLSDSAQEVAKGNFDAPLPTFKHNDEVAQLRNSFGTMQQSLKKYMEDLKASTTAKAALESELNIARDIQLSKVPTEFPERLDLDIFASMTQKCEKACEQGAVKVTDFCAYVTPELCTNCGACVETCPQNCITYFK